MASRVTTQAAVADCSGGSSSEEKGGLDPVQSAPATAWRGQLARSPTAALCERWKHERRSRRRSLEPARREWPAALALNRDRRLVLGELRRSLVPGMAAWRQVLILLVDKDPSTVEELQGIIEYKTLPMS